MASITVFITIATSSVIGIRCFKTCVFFISPHRYQPCSVFSRHESYFKFKTSEILHPEALSKIIIGIYLGGERFSKLSSICVNTPSGIYFMLLSEVFT